MFLICKLLSFPSIEIVNDSRNGSLSRGGGVGSTWKGMSLWTRKARPPPLFVPLSFLTRV